MPSPSGPEVRQILAGGAAQRNRRETPPSEPCAPKAARETSGARGAAARFSRPFQGAGFFVGAIRWFRSCLTPPPANFCRPFGPRSDWRRNPGYVARALGHRGAFGPADFGLILQPLDV